MTAADRVLLVSPKTPPMGGMGRWTETVLREAAHHPAIAIDHIDTAPRWRAFHDLGVGKRLVGGSLQGARDAHRLRRALRRPAVGMALATAGRLAVARDCLFLRLARARKVPGYLHVHMGRLPLVIQRNGWEWRLTSRAMRLASAVVVLDAASEAAVGEALPGTRVIAIPNCVSSRPGPTRPHRTAPPEPEIVYVGLIYPPKGVADLVDAWRGVARRSRLTLVGPGDPAFVSRLRRLADEAGAAARLTCTGEVSHDEALRRIARADVFVLPSLTEGFPYVIAEAMAAEGAIVATRVGAVADMLAADSPSPCGLIVEPGDAAGLRRAIERLLADPALRRELGRRAGRRVEAEYSAPAVFARLERLWRGLDADVEPVRARA